MYVVIWKKKYTSRLYLTSNPVPDRSTAELWARTNLPKGTKHGIFYLDVDNECNLVVR